MRKISVLVVVLWMCIFCCTFFSGCSNFKPVSSIYFKTEDGQKITKTSQIYDSYGLGERIDKKEYDNAPNDRKSNSYYNLPHYNEKITYKSEIKKLKGLSGFIEKSQEDYYYTDIDGILNVPSSTVINYYRITYLGRKYNIIEVYIKNDSTIVIKNHEGEKTYSNVVYYDVVYLK